MKYLKIHIRRGDINKRESQMVYPAIYNAKEVQHAMIGGILYPREIGLGAPYEDCIICISDNEMADMYIEKSKGDIVEQTEEEVDLFMSTRWEHRKEGEERVTDQYRLLAIQVKLDNNQQLTKEDQDALDPDKRIPGINRVNLDHNIFFHRYKIDNQEKFSIMSEKNK